MFILVSLLVTLASVGIAYRWATSVFPWLRRRRRALVAVLITLVVAQPALQWLAAHVERGWTASLQTISILLFASFEIAAGPIALLLGLSWAVARVRRANPARDSSAPVGAITRRQVVEGTGGVAFLAASGSLLGWGMVRGRHEFQLAELPVRIAGLPRTLDGYVIVQISDIHTGRHVGERELGEGLALVRAARPDLVVVTGDLVDFERSFAPLVARKLADLPARDGVTAILGNHDYYAGAASVLAALRAAGVDTLVDEGRSIRAGDGGGFALLGVDDRASPRYGRPGPRLDRALSMVAPGVPRILLSHQPTTVDWWAGQVALQLSGHTHGGQINPGINLADVVLKYVAGPYAVRGTTLYVNRGFGTAGPPSRVGAAPEVTRIVLVAA